MRKKYITLSLITILSSATMLQANDVKSSPETTLSDLNQSSKKTDTLLATVNGHKIWESYFDKSFSKLSPEKKNRTINNIVDAELLVQYASKQPLFKDKQLQEKVKSDGEKLKSQGKKFTEQDYRMVLGLKVINHLAESFAKKSITDEELKEYYNKRKKNFKNLPFVDYIVATLNSKEDAEKILKAMKKAKKSEQKETFLKLTKKYTTEKSKIDVNREYKFGVPRTPFTANLFQLKKGSYTQKPIEMPNKTYKLIYCTDKGELTKAPTEKDLKKNIRFIVEYKKKLDWVHNKIEELKKEAKIKIEKKF